MEKKLFYREFDIGLGYFYKRNSGETWEVEQDGNIKMMRTSTEDILRLHFLLLFGKHDYIVPPALAYDTYNNISSEHKKIVIFEHSGHSPMDNVDWKYFTNEIIEFIETYK